jgi:hypothetical protein
VWPDLGWQPPEVIAHGPFHSEAYGDDMKEQWDWLLANSRLHSVANLAEIEQRYAKLYADTPGTKLD